MDPTTLTVAGLAFAGSCIAQKCADASLDAAWLRIAAAFRRWTGSEPTSQVLEEFSAQRAVDPVLLKEAELVFGLSTALRRARLVAQVLNGARVLWVDDHPENNTWERSLLRAFGADTTNVESTRSALACLERDAFDLVVSDVSREGRSDEGVRALPEINGKAVGVPIVLYVGSLSHDVPPAGAFGITNEPNELLHLILDGLERARV